MLDDQQALQLLIDSYNQFYKSTQIIMFIADKNFQILAVNDAAINIWQPEFIEKGRKGNQLSFFNDIFSDYELFPKIKQLHQKITATMTPVSVLGVNFNRKPEFTAMIFHLEPIINKDTGNLIAVRIRGNVLSNPLSWYNLPKLLRQNHIQKDRLQTQDKFLNTREHEILFLMFHFETYEEIAAVLGMSYNQIITKNAVGKYIRSHLYPKFSVIDNHELKLKAAKLGYNKKIPLSLIPSMIVELGDM